METSTQPEYAGFWIRSVAYSIDSLIYLVLGYAVSLALGQGSVMSSIVSTGVTMIYYVGFLSSSLQATPGKWLLQLYVSTAQGEKPSLLRVFARYVVITLPALPSMVITILYPGMENLVAAYLSQDFYAIQQANHDLAPVISLIEIASVFSTVCMLIIYLPVAFTEQKTGLHDLICKTRVLRGRPDNAISVT